MNMTAFEKFAKQVNEVVSGRRGFVSLTQHAKACECKREKLEVIADMAGLLINRKSGSFGVTAMRGEA